METQKLKYFGREIPVRQIDHENEKDNKQPILSKITEIVDHNPQSEISIQVDSIEFSKQEIRKENPSEIAVENSSFIQATRSHSLGFQVTSFPMRKIKLKRGSISTQKSPADFDRGLAIRPNSTGFEFESPPQPYKTLNYFKHNPWENLKYRKLKPVKVNNKDSILVIKEKQDMSYALDNRNTPLKIRSPPHSVYKKLKPINSQKYKNIFNAQASPKKKIRFRSNKDLEITGIKK
ncbi:unnamed protein product [Blepharisma stoltei]|uniref:Uncharacterized protein n=1 Tax=Blepharisma stoltei TaxID=1481888 RepID=A0AAU9JT23_9CILI|nr:unnamed protein product [Blepharisma stoltei]